jgi:hypothetical protein
VLLSYLQQQGVKEIILHYQLDLSTSSSTYLNFVITWNLSLLSLNNMSNPASSPPLSSSLRLKIPNSLPISPSPHIRALYENEHEHSSFYRCEQCHNQRTRTTNTSASTSEPSPHLDSEQTRPVSFTQQLGQKLKSAFLAHSWSGRKKEGKSQRESPKMECVQISPTRDWTAD